MCREEHDVLERARDAEPDDRCARLAQEVLAVEDDAAGVRLVEARDDVERRRLAGAVRPDQPGDLALVDRERDVVERDDAAEGPGHVLDREDRGHGRARS